MTILQTPTPVIDKSAKTKTVWIGWLNEEQGTKANESNSAKDVLAKKGMTLLDDLHGVRATKFEQEIKAEENRLELIKSQIPSTEFASLTTLIGQARVTLTKELSEPVHNEIALNAITNLKRKVNEACKTVKPGIGPVLKEIVNLENSIDFKAAVALTGGVGGSVDLKLTQIKDSLKSPIKPGDVSKELAALQKSVSEMVRLQSASLLLIEQAKTEHQNLAKEIAREVQAIQDGCQQHLTSSLDYIQAAEKLEVETPAKLNDVSLLKAAIEKYTGDVASQLNLAKQERTAASKFQSDFKLLTDPQKKKDFAELTRLQVKIKTIEPGATDAGFAEDSTSVLAKKITDTGFKSTDIKTVSDFLARMELAIKTARENWEQKKIECGALIRYVDQLLATTALSDDDYVRGKDSRTTLAQEMQSLGEKARDKYEEAIGEARGLKYVAATTILSNALATGGALDEMKKRQQTASELLGSTKTKETDLKARKEAFNTAMGDVTSKSRIRFSDDAMALMMNSGIGMDDDGDVVYSEQFRLMEAQLEVGLKMWNKLREAGCDPFKAAERAFEGIPENFWPPQAVRVIAMFRKAEAEFAGERELAELEEGLLASRVSEGVDEASELLQNAGDRAKDAFDGMLAYFKETHKSELKGLSDDQIKDKAADFFKSNNKIDFKVASDVMGGLAAGIGAINGAYKTIKDAKDIHDAVKKGNSYDPEKDSPVKLKLAEFERNRAIWHLISDMADTVISALGPATDAVPALGLLGDIKSLALDVADAALYFSRLKEVFALKSIAKTDPESLAELALANEAAKLGLLGSEKTFTAAIAIAKIVGQGLDMGGITAAAGFGVKAGATILMYCGKGVFKLIRWSKRKKAISVLAAARANPTDINCVERVFEKCTMYSRFLLADGALNGDAWCRQYIIKRGVSDSDLDSPNTSTAILREYLNVTFENKSGDAETDDDLGTAEREKKEKAAKKSDQLEYTSWQAATVVASVADFDKNYNSATSTTGGLSKGKSDVKYLRTLLGQIETAITKTQLEIEKANEAFDAYSLALSQNKDVSGLVPTAETTMSTGLNSAAALANLINSCQDECRTGFVPLSTTKDTKGKFKIHATFQIYLRELADSLDVAYQPMATFRNDSSKRTMALRLKMDLSSSDLGQKAREELNKLSEEGKQRVEQRRLQVTTAIEKLWEGLTLKTKCGGSGSKGKLITKVAARTEIAATEFQTEVDKRFASVKKPILQTAAAMCFKLVSDEQQEITKAKTELTGTKLDKQLKKINTSSENRVKKEIIEYAKNKASELLASEFDDAVSEVFSQKTSVDNKFAAPGTIELTRDYWKKCKAKLEEKKWKFAKTGIGLQLEVYEEAYRNWDRLPKDNVLQADYNGAFGKLLQCMNNLPVLRTDGIEVPGLRNFRGQLIAKLKEEKTAFDKRISDTEEPDPKAKVGGWAVPESKLEKWPITLEGWYLVHDLAQKHGWEGHNGRRSIGRYFRRLDDALDDFQNPEPTASVEEQNEAKGIAKKCALELKTELTKWDPNTKMLRSKAEHPGIMAYKEKMISRIQSDIIDTTLA